MVVSVGQKIKVPSDGKIMEFEVLEVHDLPYPDYVKVRNIETQEVFIWQTHVGFSEK